MASVDKLPSWTARASLAVVPIIPPPSRELTRNQNQPVPDYEIDG
jgi:hypothetical protein